MTTVTLESLSLVLADVSFCAITEQQVNLSALTDMPWLISTTKSPI